MSPFLELLLFPEKFLPFPVWSTVTPEKEVDIETRTNKSFQVVDHKSHHFGRDQKMKVSIALKGDMKTAAEPPRHDCSIQDTDSSVRRTVYRRKTARWKKDPFGEEEG
jgi:hypothetical protein